MHHIYHSLFNAIADREAADTPVADRNATAVTTARRSAPCGSFALRSGHAMALLPHAAATLRVSQGTAWVTLPSQPGDHFLSAGDTLRVEAGDRLVMEPWHKRISPAPTTEPLYFEWDLVPLQIATSISVPQAVQPAVALSGSWHRLARQPAAQPAQRASYCAAVLAPLADLRAAVALGAGAAARLTVGLATWSLGSAWRAVLAGVARFATALVAARAAFTLA